MIEIYTDGSSTKHRSGWGWVLPWSNGATETGAGQEDGATNQRMELTAALEALKFWKHNYQQQDDVTIYSDSAYLCNCYFDKWWINWLSNGWVNSKKEPVANKDLWEQLVPFFNMPEVHLVKVKGHSGHVYNDIADKLATGAISNPKAFDLKIDEINDKINIELSEILLDYKMCKYPVDETIKRIRKVCGCE